MLKKSNKKSAKSEKENLMVDKLANKIVQHQNFSKLKRSPDKNFQSCFNLQSSSTFTQPSNRSQTPNTHNSV